MRNRETRGAKALLATASLVAMIAASQAQAQETETDDEKAVDEIVVTGVRGSLKDAIAIKRNAETVVESISMKDIGQLPDVTIAEALVRLPGVGGTNDRGNASQATVRGMGPRLTMGMVNGREVATAEPSRGIRWEQYPSEMTWGVDLHKTQSADLIAGGVAGTINLKTMKPLDHDGSPLTVRAGGVYYESGESLPDYGRIGHRVSGAAVHKFNDNFAVALGATSQRQKNGSMSVSGWSYTPIGWPYDINGDGTEDNAPWGAKADATRQIQDRLGVMGVIQMRPSDNFEMVFDGLYTSVDIHALGNQTWFEGFSDGWNYDADSAIVIGSTVTGGSINGINVKYNTSDYKQKNEVFIGGWNGKWSGDDWTLAADASYSKAERNNNWANIQLKQWGMNVDWDFRDGQAPSIVLNDGAPLDATQNIWEIDMNAGPENLVDEIKSFKFDFEKEIGGDFLTSFQFGARIADRDKVLNKSSFWGGATSTVPADLLTETYAFPDQDLPDFLNANFDELSEALFDSPDYSVGNDVPENGWGMNEKTASFYGKLNLATDLGNVRMTGNAGMRVEQTRLTSDGMEKIGSGASWVPITIENDYTYVLPSLNLNFHLDDEHVLRVGVARTMARPPLDELRANRTVYEDWLGEKVGTRGNPNLKPFMATTFDASFEWYFHDEALAAVAVYYKDVSTHIGYLTMNEDVAGDTYAITGPENGEGGNIKGVELTFQTPFYFLDGFLSDFGVYSNYAFVDTNLREFTPEDDPMPAGGMAKHTATFDLWYQKSDIEVRLGLSHSSQMTAALSWSPTKIITIPKRTSLDFSARYNISDNVSARFQVSNLTNKGVRTYLDNDMNRLDGFENYGRRVSFDLTFTM